MKIKISEQQLKLCVNTTIKENYPAGAEHDPRAPWNQKDEPNEEISEIDVIDDDVDNFNEIFVLFTSDRGGESELSLEDILKGINVGEARMNYFNTFIKQYPRPEDWENNVKFVAKIYSKLHDIDFSGGGEYEEPDYNDYDRDELD